LPDVSKPNCNGLNRVQFPATASDLCGRTLLRFAEETLLIEAVLNRISRECLNGHPVLIPEAAGILEDQLEALKTFCAEFNRIAEGRQERSIDLGAVETSMQLTIDESFQKTVNLARAQTLADRGEGQSWREALNKVCPLTS